MIFGFWTPVRSRVMIKLAHEIDFSYIIITWIPEEKSDDIVFFVFHIQSLI